MRSDYIHFNSKAALNKRKNWKYKASCWYSKKWLPELCFQTECIHVAGKSSTVELHKEDSSRILRVKWGRRAHQPRKSTVTLLHELQECFQPFRSLTSNQRKFKECHPEPTVVSTTRVDKERHVLGRSQSQNRLVKADLNCSLTLLETPHYKEELRFGVVGINKHSIWTLKINALFILCATL